MNETERLSEMLETMEVPQMRRDITSVPNLNWLQRNLGINNGAHPDTGEALAIIRRLITKS